MKIWGKEETDKCPRCGEKETAKHDLYCKEHTAVQQFGELVEHLDKWMIKVDTTPDVQDRIKLLSWKEGGTYQLEPSN